MVGLESSGNPLRECLLEFPGVGHMCKFKRNRWIYNKLVDF